MTLGFEWAKENDRQLQYNYDTFETPYIPLETSEGLGFEWKKDNDEQRQHTLTLYIHKSIFLLNNQHYTLKDNWESLGPGLLSEKEFDEHALFNSSETNRKYNKKYSVLPKRNKNILKYKIPSKNYLSILKIRLGQ